MIFPAELALVFLQLSRSYGLGDRTVSVFVGFNLLCRFLNQSTETCKDLVAVGHDRLVVENIADIFI